MQLSSLNINKSCLESSRSQSPLNEALKKQLTELYCTMKAFKFNSTKTLDDLERASIEEKEQTCSLSPRKSQKVLKIYRRNKIVDLPERSLEFYKKLNLYYKRRQQENQKDNKNKKLVNRFCRTGNKITRTIRRSNPEKVDSPRVPSLLIKISE